MAQEEGKLIAQVNIKEATLSTEEAKMKIASLYANEWVYFLLGSTNIQSISSHIFRDPYSFCRDAKVPEMNGNLLLWYFYNNKL